MTSNEVSHTSDWRTRALLLCGAIAGPFFSLAWIAEGATRANYYPLRHPISPLSIGNAGWTQATTVIITGLLMLALQGPWAGMLRKGCHARDRARSI
jgi:hypothetical protein